VRDLLTGEPVLASIAPAVDAVARLLQRRLAADGVNVLSSAGPVAGQEVLHLHVHVVPRYADEPGLQRLVNPASAPAGELESVQRQLEVRA
jgi:histidine triad (HIT) family protein